MSGRKKYSTELKLEIVDRYLKGDIGIRKLADEYHVSSGDIRKTAAHFNIPSYGTVSRWERIYYERGKDVLYREQRGRTPKMGTKQLRKSKANIEVNEDLLAEVQRLRMENEYLKN